MLFRSEVIRVAPREIAALAFGHEDVAVDLDDLLLGDAVTVPVGPDVQVVDVLRDEQEVVGERRQLGDRAMRGVWLRAADIRASLAIPLPDEVGI